MRSLAALRDDTGTGTRRVLEADDLLTADQLATRVCDAYGCPYEPHLVMPRKVA